MSAVASRSSLLMAGFWRRVVPPVLGLLFLVLVWSLIASTGDNGIPTPGQTWAQALQVFSDPFYQKGPNDQGIGWNILMSLQRVGIGFGMAQGLAQAGAVSRRQPASPWSQRQLSLMVLARL